MTSEQVTRLGGLALLVLASAFAVAVLIVAPSDPEFGYDSTAYLAAADRLRAGAPLYPELGREPGFDRGALIDDELGYFFYPPLVALAFVPLSSLPDDAARLIWYAVLIAVAASVGIVLVRRAAPDARAVTAAAYVSFLPLLSELRFGNVNLLTLAVVLAAWRLRDRVWLAGPLLAAGIGLKLLPVAVLAFLLVAGRARLVATALAAGAAVVAVTWPWLGSAWLDYVATLRALGLETPAAGSNIVPAALATPPGRYVLPAVAVLTAVAAGLVARRAPDLEDDAFPIALAAAPLLVTSVWYPYLVLALPALLRARPGAARRYQGLAGVGSWSAIQAHLQPLPLAGLIVLLVARLIGVSTGPRPAPDAAGASSAPARDREPAPAGP